MNRDSIYTFLTELLFNYLMDLTTFYNALDTHQREFEAMRPWIALQAEDSSQTLATSNTFTTAIPLAAGFSKWNPIHVPIVLTDAQNNPISMQEVSIADRFAYKNIFGKFWVDYVAQKIYFGGTVPKTYTINQYFIKSPALISAASGNVWIFDSYGLPGGQMLAHKIALWWKGIDYDIINNQNAAVLEKKVVKLEDAFTKWDADLQNAATRGVDPFASDNLSWNGGQLPGGISNP